MHATVFLPALPQCSTTCSRKREEYGHLHQWIAFSPYFMGSKCQWERLLWMLYGNGVREGCEWNGCEGTGCEERGVRGGV